MAIIVGSGDYRYEQIDNWAKVPPGWSLHEVGAVGVDRQDNVYVFNRGEHPMMVFDSEGNFLRAWGEGLFPRAHGLHMAPDDTVFLTDDGDHSVRKCTLEGKVLLTLGTPGKPAPFMSGKPFHRCTHTALSPKGEIYVSDGYGRYEAQFNNLHRPCGMFMPYCTCPICYVGELGPATRTNRNYPNLGPRVSIIDNKGNLLARIGGQHPGTGPTDYIGPHGLCVDSHGDIYIGEVSRTLWPQYWADQPVPDDVRCLRKLRKIS